MYVIHIQISSAACAGAASASRKCADRETTAAGSSGMSRVCLSAGFASQFATQFSPLANQNDKFIQNFAIQNF